MTRQIRRERWKSRFSYVVASASAIIGVGNFLRFPGIASKYDGITFLIPYVLLTWVVGYVLFTLEISCGEMYRSGAITFFEKVYSQFRGFGILQMCSTLICMSYLNVILGWLFIYMIRSSYNPWESDPKDYFHVFVLNQKEFKAEVFVTNVLSTAIIWIIMFITIYGGVTHTTKIVYMTLPLSVLMMTMLLLRSLTLPNALNALYETATFIDWSVLVKTKIWVEALGQVLFSLCIGVGTSSAYGSYRIKDGKLMFDAFVIVWLNLAIELIGWTIVVCIADFEDWTNENIYDNKFSLAFVLYPQLVMKLPYPNSWSFLYYLFMLTFGINCSHASLESIVTCLLDSKRFSVYSRVYITCVVMSTGSIMSLIFCTYADLIEPVDYFTSNFLLAFGALGEMLTVYFYNKQLVIGQVGENSVNIANLGLCIGPLIGGFVYFVTRIEHGNYLVSWFVASLIVMFGAVFSVLISSSKLPKSKIFYLLFIYHGKILIHHFNDTLRMSERKWFKLNTLWFVCLKFVATPLNIILMGVSMFNMLNMKLVYMIIGSLFTLGGFCIVILPFYLPHLYSSFVPDDKIENENRLHLDEWLRYWFLKEGKILTGNSPPLSRRASERVVQID
eukprot:NODE_1001_length_2346_cov_0.107254.p1 type:complete len:616 gc:universal NODE_1001_length_2346_cov_0.107254:115-1962(+)